MENSPKLEGDALGEPVGDFLYRIGKVQMIMGGMGISTGEDVLVEQKPDTPNVLTMIFRLSIYLAGKAVDVVRILEERRNKALIRGALGKDVTIGEIGHHKSGEDMYITIPVQSNQ